MTYKLIWIEECKSKQKVYGYVEAESEEEAMQLLSDGMVDVEDSWELENYGNEIKDIISVEEAND